MRDRRNTSLSTSSATTSDSAVNGAVYSDYEEKQPSDSRCPAILPPPVTKKNMSRPHVRSRYILVLHTCGTFCALIVLWHIVFSGTFRSVHTRLFDSETTYGVGDYSDEGVSLDELSVLRVRDTEGYSRWTVHIPQNYSFPLGSQDVQMICKEGESSRRSIIEQSRLLKTMSWWRGKSYYSPDTTFLDLEEAEDIGILPRSDIEETGNVCDKSLTFVLDADDASFGKNLLLLWLSYGLAKDEGRAFFIDDTRWSYGQYTNYFAPVPAPRCDPPPRHHLLPCPHNAKHLLIGQPKFEAEFVHRHRAGSNKNRRIFDLLRTGYEDLFHMTGEHALYSISRIAKFKEEARQHDGSVIGIHLRRGDLHPLEREFRRDYLPLERYGTAARKLLRSQLRISLPERRATANDFQAILDYVHSPLLLASDDPEMFNSAELKQSAEPFVIQKAQQRINLATKSTLDLAVPTEPSQEPGSAYLQFVAENFGWEGGYYSALFFSLGKRLSNSAGSTACNHSAESDNEPASEETKHLRQLIGQAYLLDIAVLGASDGIVCAISSATCRILAVMLGWDAIVEGRWVNVDDKNRLWSWDGRR